MHNVGQQALGRAAQAANKVVCRSLVVAAVTAESSPIVPVEYPKAERMVGDVRFWHLADTGADAEHVRS